MKKQSISIEGHGDSCARSHKVILSSSEEAIDPEIEFEADLLAALKQSSTEQKSSSAPQR